MATATTRRALLGTLAVAPAALAAPGLATTVAPAGAIRPEFQAKLDAIGRARDYARWYDEHVARPAAERAGAMQGAIPHVTVLAPARPGCGRLYDEWTTAKPADVSQAQFITSLRRQLRPASTNEASLQRLKAARSLCAAHIRRERALARAGRDSGWEEACEQDGRNSEAWADAETAFYTMLVTSFAELALKFEAIYAGDNFADECVPDALLADVRRLSGGEG